MADEDERQGFGREADDGSGSSDESAESWRARYESERAAREREQQRLDEYLRSGQTRQAETQRREPLGPAPNPADDPEAFQRWLVERDARREEELNARLERVQSETTQRVEQTTREQRLWFDFKERFPAYAKREDLAAAAFGSLARRGEMPSTDSAILEAVKREMDRMVGSPIDRMEQPRGRTEDLSGGEPPRKPKAAPAGSDDETGSSMHEAISQWKIDHGFMQA